MSNSWFTKLSDQEIEILAMAIYSMPAKVYSLAETFLERNSVWKEASAQAFEVYQNLQTLPEAEFLTDLLPHLSSWQRRIMLQLALLIILGITHYLKQAGYSIENPASFDEVHKQMAIFRGPAYRLSMYKVESSKDMNLEHYYQEAFGVGVVVGYLLTLAERRGVKVALQLIKAGRIP